jgi:hypothetical protein
MQDTIIEVCCNLYELQQICHFTPQPKRDSVDCQCGAQGTRDGACAHRPVRDVTTKASAAETNL